MIYSTFQFFSYIYYFSNNQRMEIGPFSQNEQYMYNAMLGSSHPMVCVPITYIWPFKLCITSNLQT
jgi:hypothetical protein